MPQSRVSERTIVANLPPLLTVAEVAQATRFSEVTVRGAIRSGRLRAVRPIKQWRVFREDMLAWLETGDNGSHADAARPAGGE